MASPTCLVNGSSTLNGVNVTAGSTVTISLADTAGVKSWSISCVNTDELLVAATVTAGLTIDYVAKTATFTAPSAGSALIFQSKVNNGLDANGRPDPSLTTTFGVYVLTATGYRVGAFGETLEGSSQFGWTVKFNPLIRGVVVNPASAGAGLTFSAGAYNVGQNADGSIVVNADDIQLKAAYQTLLDNATPSATANALALRDGSGRCSFGALTITGAVTAASVSTSADVTASGSHYVSSRSETRVMTDAPHYVSAQWQHVGSGVYQSLTSGTTIAFPLDVPNGATLTSVTVRIDPPNSHPGGWPTSFSYPIADVRYFDTSSGSSLSVASTTDSTSPVASYESAHNIVVSGMSHVIDKTTRRYFVRLTDESGANSLVGLQVLYVSATWTRTKVGED